VWRALRRARAKAALVIDFDGRVRDLDQRLVTLLATVTALLRRSLRRRPDPAEALADFTQRLAELQRQQPRLVQPEEERPSRSGPFAMELRGLIELALGPYGARKATARPLNQIHEGAGVGQASLPRVALAGTGGAAPRGLLVAPRHDTLRARR